MDAVWMVCGVLAVTAGSQSRADGKIQDNSFLVEEAYNQDPGVVQHIQTFQYMRDGGWTYSFTQEWPVPGRTHQLSYTVLVLHPGDAPGGADLGDAAINYRYQLVYTKDIAVAPRVSALLQTGDYRRGAGGGALGIQVNVPMSVEVTPSWVTHWNIGFTSTPGARGADGGRADTLSFNFAASAIWTGWDAVNPMLEMVWTSTESVGPGGSTARTEGFVVNPGVRAAVTLSSGLQIVPGISFPAGVGPSHGEDGVFLYLSFEHPLF